MGNMDSDKLQRLLDYHLNQDEPSDRLETQRFLSEDSEYQALEDAIRQILSPLGSLHEEVPPPGLPERTLARIRQRSEERPLLRTPVEISSGSGGIHGEQSSRARWVLSNLRNVIGVAACLMLVFVFMRPGLQKARHISQEQACASQLRSIGHGLAQYAHDNQGQMPYVLRPQGAKWLSVGTQDDQHYSNTRNMYLLVKQGYVPLDTFLCPGVSGSQGVRIKAKVDSETLEALRDFTDRNQVNYSFFLVLNRQSFFAKQGETIPIGSDQNPIFANYDSQNQPILDLSKHQDLLNRNSANHAERGQNLLFGDGHVRFSPTRHVGLHGDDIFTLNNILQYDGDEQPSTDSDILHAP